MDDSVRDGVSVITPTQTSGGAQWAYLRWATR